MKYINVFADETAYKDASLEKPQLAYITDGGKVYSLSIGGQPGPEPVEPAANEIWYTTTDGNIVESYTWTDEGTSIFDIFGANMVSNTYTDDKGIIKFDANITKVADENGHGGFTGCETLETIQLPNAITSIGYYSFGGCTNITNIIIINSVISIEFCAFAECSELANVIIPNSVISIGDYVWGYCINLNNINYSGTKSQWNAITKGEYWHYGCPEITVHCTDGDIIIPSEIEEE